MRGRKNIRPIPGQLDLFKTAKGKVVPNSKLKVVKENKAKEAVERKAKKEEALRLKVQRVRQRNEQKVKNTWTKITAYNLAWKLINSGKVRPGTAMIEEAWFIVKKLSPAKGVNKIGRRAGFKRVFYPTASNLRGLEVSKLRIDIAERFVDEAKKILAR